jgi:pilus assembly protein CpaC
MTSFRGALLAALAALLLLAMPPGARAQDAILVLGQGEGTIVRLPEPAATVFVAEPEIADVQAPSGRAFFVLGKRTGRTTIYALSADSRVLLTRQVEVRHNLGHLEDMLRRRFPDYALGLSSAPGSLMVSGAVDTPADAEAIISSLASTLGKEEQIVNHLTIRSPTQVHLRVRIAEVSREVTQILGINWGALSAPGNWRGGLLSGRDFVNDAGQVLLSDDGAWSAMAGFVTNNINITALIDALDQESMLTVLAEPNLTAVSGQTASFLAGGEFPIPIGQDDDTISIEFKPFGVALDFTPTVISRDRISLTVRPEVSELSEANSIELDGLRIPGLTVRRVETTVELASGQSLAIGGLLQDNVRDVVSRLPGLGDLPILGRLFSSSDYLNNKSELVVIVTPYVVRPTDPDALKTPAQTLRPASDVEFILHRRLNIDPLDSNLPRLTGDAGFVY